MLVEVHVPEKGDAGHTSNAFQRGEGIRVIFTFGCPAGLGE